MLLRWHEVDETSVAPRRGDGAADRNAARRHVSLSDDVGTRYEHFHTSEAHCGAVVVWTACFATPVPVAACELRVQIRTEQLVMVLPRQDVAT